MFGEQIEINEKKYTLKFNINTLCQMASDGINVMAMNETTMDFTMIRSLFFYGLQKFHKSEIQDMDAAGDLISDYIECGGDFEEFTNILTTSLMKALGIKDKTSEKKQGKSKAK